LTGQIWGSVLGTFAGFTAAHAGLLRARWSRRPAGGAFAAHAVSATACLAEWREHSVNLVLAGLVNTAAWQIPPLLLREFWGASSAGLYALAFRISCAPLALVQTAISDVAYRETTIRLQAGAGLREYMRRSTLALFVLSAAIAVAVALATPWAVPAVLGEKWQWVVRLLPWMMLSFVFRITGGTLSLFTQTGRTRLLLAWQIAFLLANLACFSGAHLGGLGLQGVTIAAALVQSAFYLLLLLVNFALAANPSRR
jgi:O-antigen/teichoic acid export membrane protein